MTPEETGKLIDWFRRNLPAMEHHNYGGAVEYTDASSPKQWRIASSPTWDIDLNYRAKPKKPRMATSYLSDASGSFDCIELTPEVLAILKEAGLIE